jgi:hypothetical protein
VYTTLLPAGRSTVSTMLPDPVAVQVAPPEGAQLQVNPAPTNGMGSGSDTPTPTALEGPELATVTT